LAGEQLELRSAQVVLHEAPELDPAALRFARKALGLTQTDLAKKLSLTQETISRHETGALRAPNEYRYALAGLLAHEDQVVLGKPLGHLRVETAA
jgi:predicted transcriptional regulator